MHKSTGLKYEASSEPLHISAVKESTHASLRGNFQKKSLSFALNAPLSTLVWAGRATIRTVFPVQVYPIHKKPPPCRTLQEGFARAL